MIVPNDIRQSRNGEQGSALIMTLMVLLVLTLIGTGTVYLTGSHHEIAANSRAGDQALYVAEAGINWGLRWAEDNGLAATAAGHTETTTLRDGADSPVQFSGPTGAVDATVEVEIGPSPDSQGQSITCGLVGFSERYGSPRFRVDSLGMGPGGSRRAIEAHVMLPPQEGLCPPGTNVVGGYAGGG